MTLILSFGFSARAWATSVPLQGKFPPELQQARAAGLFTLPAPPPSGPRSALHPMAAAGGTQGTWRIPVLLVSFSDQPPGFPAQRFRTLLFDTLGTNPHGSLSEYYATVSRGALRVVGDVYGWYTLPHTRSFYAGDGYGVSRIGAPRNDAGLVQDALGAADGDVDFTRYDRDGDGVVDYVMVAHVGQGAEVVSGDRTQIWSITSSLEGAWDGVSAYDTNDIRPGSGGFQKMKVKRFSIVPERSALRADSLTEIGVYCHEFGHGLGWPDLYDATSLGGGPRMGPGNWCLMATGEFGGDSRSPDLPVRPCAWALMDFGWTSVENITTSEARRFPPIAAPDGHAYRLWWQGEASAEYFLLENRTRTGYDANQPGEGLLVYRVADDVIASRRASNSVNSGSIPGLRVEEADGFGELSVGGNRGDEGDPFPGQFDIHRFADDTQPSARSYLGRYTNVSLSQIAWDGADITTWTQVTPEGWSPPEMTPTSGRLRTAGDRPLVRRGPHLQLLCLDDADSARVVAARRSFDVSWDAPQRVSSVAGATDATWSDPASGPLVALWSDRRDGAPEIYYRAWEPPGAERRATFSPAFATRPSAAWLPDGRLALLWLDTREGKNQLYFKSFLPGGEAAAEEVRLSDPSLTPELLEFATAFAPGGGLFAAYTVRGKGSDEIYWQHFYPDSGWTVPARLSYFDGFPSGSPDLAVIPGGRLIATWRDVTPTRTSVQTALYDLASGELVPTPPELFSIPISIPSLRVGPGSADATAVVIARGGDQPFDRVLFGLQHPDGAWDQGLGWINFGSDSWASDPQVDVTSDGTITVVWTTAGPHTYGIWTTKHLPGLVSPVAVDPVGLPTGPARVWAAPNPASTEVRFSWSVPTAGAWLSIYSPAGRRVARLAAMGSGVSWRGRASDGGTLAPGIYFFRLEDERGTALGRSGKLIWLR